MKRLLKIAILVSVLICLIVFPVFVKAGIVPCGTSSTPNCELCHFLILIRNIFDFILKILVPLAVLFAIGAGVLILISRGSQMALQGKKILTSVVIGIAIALASWTIVNTIIVALANHDVFPLPWNSWDIDCPIVSMPLSEALETEYIILNDTGPEGASPGDTIRYSLTYHNISSEDLSNVSIIIDYDQEQVILFPAINLSPDQLPGAANEFGRPDLNIDNDKITWNIGDLNSQESKEIYYDFILTEDTDQFLDPTNPSAISYYQNNVAAYSNEAEDENFEDLLALTLSFNLFAERQYYLTLDVDGDGLPTVGDRLRYNIKYHNPTSSAFNNVVIISDYSEGFTTITKIDGGGVDDGDKITWTLGDLEEGEPSSDNPGCIGYNLTVVKRPGGLVIPNRFYIMSEGGILETGNDIFNIEEY